MLAENSRGGDIMISAGEGDFLILLPDTTEQGAGQIAQRIRKTLVTHMFPELENDCVKNYFWSGRDHGQGNQFARRFAGGGFGCALGTRPSNRRTTH